MAIDPGNQIIGLVVNGVLVALISALVWFVRQAYKGVTHMIEKVNHIDECLDRTQKETTAALRETRDDVVEVKRRLEKKDESDMHTQRELAYLKGIVGTPLDQPVGMDSREEKL